MINIIRKLLFVVIQGDLLCSFAKANDGKIRICSNKVLYRYNILNKSKKSQGIKDIYNELSYSLEGTLFEMDIIEDNKRKYIL